MIIQAKFKSVCPTCQNEILEGSDVEWKRGQKAEHVECNVKRINEEKEILLAEWENELIRIDDKIELKEDIYNNGIFGNKESELIAPSGTKGRVYETTLSTGRINGIIYKNCVKVEEVVRKGKEPKSKTGYFLVPLELLTITKKAKLKL
jgi:hypothetical protein